MRMLVDAMNLRVCVLDNSLFHGFIEWIYIATLEN